MAAVVKIPRFRPLAVLTWWIMLVLMTAVISLAGQEPPDTQFWTVVP